MIDAAQAFLDRAQESLAGAEVAFSNQRYNNCANRCYYACFQAAIYALLRPGVQPRGSSPQWEHSFVQAQFVGHLINRRKLYPTGLRNVLMDTFEQRREADYGKDGVTERDAARVLRQTRTFLAALRATRGVSS